MAEGVSQLVTMDLINAGLPTAPTEHRRHAAVSKAPLQRQPQPVIYPETAMQGGKTVKVLVDTPG